jgi:hypothetical protein
MIARLRDRVAFDAFRFGSLAAQITPGIVADAGASMLGIGLLAGMRE